jgi:hypothetical protein
MRSSYFRPGLPTSTSTERALSRCPAQEQLSAATQTARNWQWSVPRHRSSQSKQHGQAKQHPGTSHAHDAGPVERRSGSQHQRADCDQPAVIAPSRASSYGVPAIVVLHIQSRYSQMRGNRQLLASPKPSKIHPQPCNTTFSAPAPTAPALNILPIALRFGYYCRKHHVTLHRSASLWPLPHHRR